MGKKSPIDPLASQLATKAAVSQWAAVGEMVEGLDDRLSGGGHEKRKRKLDVINW